METFFECVLLFMLFISIIMNFVVLYHTPSLEDIELKILDILENSFEEKIAPAIVMNNDRLIEMIDKIKHLSMNIDRSMLALRDTLEPTKPMKSNNWDSIREAFKRPPKVDLDDRD
jgi:hypothetical protein